jgi:hypothetical protein
MESEVGLREAWVVQQLPASTFWVIADSPSSLIRSHNPWQEADRKAQCEKFARWV